MQIYQALIQLSTLSYNHFKQNSTSLAAIACVICNGIFKYFKPQLFFPLCQAYNNVPN